MILDHFARYFRTSIIYDATNFDSRTEILSIRQLYTDYRSTLIGKTWLITIAEINCRGPTCRSLYSTPIFESFLDILRCPLRRHYWYLPFASEFVQIWLITLAQASYRDSRHSPVTSRVIPEHLLHSRRTRNA